MVGTPGALHVAALAASAAVLILSACNRAPTLQHLDKNKVDVNTNAQLRTANIGRGRFVSLATFVLVDAINETGQDAAVTLGGVLVDHAGAKLSELRPDEGGRSQIVRIRPDGTVPDDNPFAGQPGALPEIWTVGHRNVQSAAFDARGQLWTVEHGAQGGDELNKIEKGKNYGWPIIAYGEEYSGQPIGEGLTARPGLEQPVYYWDPVIAPSGAVFYRGGAFPEWRGNLFVGALRDTRLVRLVLENDRVTGEEHLLVERGKRIRDVAEGPDGFLYVVTDEQDGELWRIAPRRIPL